MTLHELRQKYRDDRAALIGKAISECKCSDEVARILGVRINTACRLIRESGVKGMKAKSRRQRIIELVSPHLSDQEFNDLMNLIKIHRYTAPNALIGIGRRDLLNKVKEN